MEVIIKKDVTGLGKRIKQAREESGKSVTELAAAAGMSNANWHRIEGEVNHQIPYETLLRVQTALGVQFDLDLRL